MANNKYISGEIEHFGEFQIPSKTPLTVLPADDNEARTIGFAVFENLGSPVYLAPDDFDGGEVSEEVVEACMDKAKVLRNLDDIKIGTKLFIPSLFGAAYGIVTYKDPAKEGEFSAHSKSGNHGFYLSYSPHYLRGFDRPQDIWVCWGEGNLAGIRKLELYAGSDPA